jgi:hypothetical protein
VSGAPSVLNNVQENFQGRCPSNVAQIFASSLLKLADLSEYVDQIFQVLEVPKDENQQISILNVFPLVEQPKFLCLH